MYTLVPKRSFPKHAVAPHCMPLHKVGGGGEYVPAAQAAHAVAPLPLSVPAGHNAQADELGSGAYVPAVQGAAMRLGQLVPAGQLRSALGDGPSESNKILTPLGFGPWPVTPPLKTRASTVLTPQMRPLGTENEYS